jgi:hypothetical protein
MMGLCLVAAFALTAIGAGTASALPEVGRCVAKAGGKYKNSNCTETAKTGGTFEFLKGAKSETEGVKFTSAGGEGVLETKAGTKVVCKTQSATGKYDQDSGIIKEVENVVAKFNGCGIPALGIACNSKGSGTEEIVTKSLHGPLGYISGEKTKTPVVGQELTPDVKLGAFAEFECGGGAASVVVKEGAEKGGNCIIAPVEPANTMGTSVKQHYSGSAGVQNPQHFQNLKPPICNLESSLNKGAAERATQALETTITNEEALEIKA